MELAEIRREIDRIDPRLLELFLERLDCSSEVAQTKKESGAPVINALRETEIIREIAERAGEKKHYAEKLFRALLELSRERQNELIDGDFRDSEAWKAVSDMRINCMNIILIGMPGSGKTTVSGILGKMTGRPVIETDDIVSKNAGRSVPQIIETEGEELFRKLESEAVLEACRNEGVIIATGGGTVTRPQNYLPLHRSGLIYHLERDTKLLPITGRPLSRNTDLNDLYRQRRHMYLSFRDRTSDNNGTAENCAVQIWEDFLETAEKRRF